MIYIRQDSTHGKSPADPSRGGKVLPQDILRCPPRPFQEIYLKSRQTNDSRLCLSGATAAGCLTFRPVQDDLGYLTHICAFTLRRAWAQVIPVQTEPSALFRAVQPFDEHRTIVKIQEVARPDGKCGSAGMGKQKEPSPEVGKVDLVTDHAKIRVAKKGHPRGPAISAFGTEFERFRLRLLHF